MKNGHVNALLFLNALLWLKIDASQELTMERVPRVCRLARNECDIGQACRVCEQITQIQRSPCNLRTQDCRILRRATSQRGAAKILRVSLSFIHPVVR
jgi:hypothetical protein